MAPCTQHMDMQKLATMAQPRVLEGDNNSTSASHMANNKHAQKSPLIAEFAFHVSSAANGHTGGSGSTHSAPLPRLAAATDSLPNTYSPWPSHTSHTMSHLSKPTSDPSPPTSHLPHLTSHHALPTSHPFQPHWLVRPAHSSALGSASEPLQRITSIMSPPPAIWQPPTREATATHGRPEPASWPATRMQSNPAPLATSTQLLSTSTRQSARLGADSAPAVINSSQCAASTRPAKTQVHAHSGSIFQQQSPAAKLTPCSCASHVSTSLPFAATTTPHTLDAMLQFSLLPRNDPAMQNGRRPEPARGRDGAYPSSSYSHAPTQRRSSTRSLDRGLAEGSYVSRSLRHGDQAKAGVAHPNSCQLYSSPHHQHQHQKCYHHHEQQQQRQGQVQGHGLKPGQGHREYGHQGAERFSIRQQLMALQQEWVKFDGPSEAADLDCSRHRNSEPGGELAPGNMPQTTRLGRGLLDAWESEPLPGSVAVGPGQNQDSMVNGSSGLSGIKAETTRPAPSHMAQQGAGQQHPHAMRQPPGIGTTGSPPNDMSRQLAGCGNEGSDSGPAPVRIAHVSAVLPATMTNTRATSPANGMAVFPAKVSVASPALPQAHNASSTAGSPPGLASGTPAGHSMVNMPGMSHASIAVVQGAMQAKFNEASVLPSSTPSSTAFRSNAPAAAATSETAAALTAMETATVLNTAPAAAMTCDHSGHVGLASQPDVLSALSTPSGTMSVECNQAADAEGLLARLPTLESPGMQEQQQQQQQQQQQMLAQLLQDEQQRQQRQQEFGRPAPQLENAAQAGANLQQVLRQDAQPSHHEVQALQVEAPARHHHTVALPQQANQADVLQQTMQADMQQQAPEVDMQQFSFTVGGRCVADAPPVWFTAAAASPRQGQTEEGAVGNDVWGGPTSWPGMGPGVGPGVGATAGDGYVGEFLPVIRPSSAPGSPTPKASNGSSRGWLTQSLKHQDAALLVLGRAQQVADQLQLQPTVPSIQLPVAGCNELKTNRADLGLLPIVLQQGRQTEGLKCHAVLDDQPADVGAPLLDAHCTIPKLQPLFASSTVMTDPMHDSPDATVTMFATGLLHKQLAGLQAEGGLGSSGSNSQGNTGFGSCQTITLGDTVPEAHYTPFMMAEGMLEALQSETRPYRSLYPAASPQELQELACITASSNIQPQSESHLLKAVGAQLRQRPRQMSHLAPAGETNMPAAGRTAPTGRLVSTGTQSGGNKLASSPAHPPSPTHSTPHSHAHTHPLPPSHPQPATQCKAESAAVPQLPLGCLLFGMVAVAVLLIIMLNVAALLMAAEAMQMRTAGV